jgi:hypothetical protein
VKIQNITFYPPALTGESRSWRGQSPRLGGQELSRKADPPRGGDRRDRAVALPRATIVPQSSRSSLRPEVVRTGTEVHGWLVRYGVGLYVALPEAVNHVVDCSV